MRSIDKDQDVACEGCKAAVPVPKELVDVVDIVYCDDCFNFGPPERWSK